MFLLNGTKKFIIKDKIPKKIKPNNPASLVLIFFIPENLNKWWPEAIKNIDDINKSIKREIIE